MVKTLYKSIGILEVILALIALYFTLSRAGHPAAQMGWLLVIVFGLKGLYYIFFTGGPDNSVKE
jgi:hypothetical protein